LKQNNLTKSGEKNLTKIFIGIILLIPMWELEIEYGGDMGSTGTVRLGKQAGEGHSGKNQPQTIPEREVALAA